jgi:hypothetical protein
VIHTLPIDSEINILLGNVDEHFNDRPITPYSELVCEFLNSVSIAILAHERAKKLPDVVSFAFWCRKANIEKRKKQFLSDSHYRLGLGMVFHITPSNVPINFAFSYVFSLLAGNSNIVKVPTKEFSQVEIVCEIFNELFQNKKYKEIADRTAFIRYSHNDIVITRLLSSSCNARLIWGGNNTINEIRKWPVPERSIEIAFADRYSFCVIDVSSISTVDDNTLRKLAASFYNDTYLMDQNACSSPHLIVWLSSSLDRLFDVKEKFWHYVSKLAEEKYDLQPVNAIDKYVLFCKDSIERNCIHNFKNYKNILYRLEINRLPDTADSLRGKCGYFYEYHTDDINSIAFIVNNKYQTLTYYGLEKELLVDFVIRNQLSGIDRIVPMGSALDIDIIWDGCDLVRSLSRIIDIR